MVPFTMSTSLAASVLVWACTLQAVTASTYDGLPRPKGFPDAPTTAYGKYPPAYITMNQAADCDWYGFANVNYPADIGMQCLEYTFKTEVMDEANQGTLRPYEYLTCSRWVSSKICYDSAWYNYYCQVGCFYMGNSSLPLPPVTALPPPSPPAAPGNTAPGNTSPGSTTPQTSRGTALLQPASVMVLICGGILAAVGLFNRW